jgi:60 kDa SS-A/Ro ribonucleoprotein
MANKNLFATLPGKLLPQTDALNHEGGRAYSFSPKHKLAQLAATGCFNSTFYASAEAQLQEILGLCGQVEPSFVAKAAVYTRQHGFMKDTPALLCAALSVLGPDLLGKVFARVIDSGKMLRNFVQVLRSGAVARKSLGTLPKRLVRQWLAARSDQQLFHDSVGQSPSVADIVRMVHPKPAAPEREALYGYLLGRPYRPEALPEIVQRFEAYKADRGQPVPEVPFQMLTALDLGPKEWIEIARHASWQMTRMNLNTFARHGVFKNNALKKLVAQRLRDPRLVEMARVFPYQLLVAYKMASSDVPSCVQDALQDAMELALGNVPAVGGQVYVCPDVSGSMSSPVTGLRKGATSAVRCVDVAALVAAAVLRKNPQAEVLPFEHRVVSLKLNARDSVLTNAQKLAAIGGGGTACSAPLALLNERRAHGDLVIFVSDNESWVDARGGRGTATLQEWERFRERNPAARLVCIDIQPYGTTQAKEREDVLNVGGFSDAVFEVVSAFAQGELTADHWVGRIEAVEL